MSIARNFYKSIGEKMDRHLEKVSSRNQIAVQKNYIKKESSMRTFLHSFIERLIYQFKVGSSSFLLQFMLNLKDCLER